MNLVLNSNQEYSARTSFWSQYHFKMNLFWILVAVLSKLVFRRMKCFSSVNVPLSTFVKSSLYIFSLLFSYLALNLLQPFRCVEQPDGRSLVYSDLSVYCFEKDWNENVKISSIYMVEFLFLIPGIIVALMIRFRNQIGSEEEREWIGSLTNAYRPGVFWWDFVSMLKKLFLSLSLSLNKKSLFFCAVLSLFHIVETILKPYKLESQAKLNNV